MPNDSYTFATGYTSITISNSLVAILLSVFVIGAHTKLFGSEILGHSEIKKTSKVIQATK